jgi:two-component sensor histidine kinase
MIAIILLSSIPLAVLSGVVSWHNYEGASGTSAVRAASLVSIFRSRTQQDIAQTTAFLRHVSALDELRDPVACNKALHLALVIQGPRYTALRLTDDQGRVLCAAGDSQIAPSAVPDARLAIGRPGQHTTLQRVLLIHDAHGAPVLTAELVSRSVADPSRFLTAELRLGWPRTDFFGDAGRVGIIDRDLPMHAWLLGPDGIVAPVCQDCGWAIPNEIAGLRRAAGAGHGAAVAAGEGSMALGPLAGPVDVLIVTQPTREEVRALSIFIIRVIGIVVLLGVGLVAVAVGANMLVVAPLQRLTAAVTHWRRAGDYDAHDTRLMPVELRELSRAFTQATRSLALHERNLREAEAKQELLIKEIHHRVKNNLQIIASLLNLQANRIRQPEARAEFASARDRVRALATLHRYLYSEGELQTLNMRSFLQELCTQLFQAIGEKQGRRIQLQIEAPEIAMATDQAVPLSLVVTEAVSNAVKYAFPGGRSGYVKVSLSELGDGMGRLVIQDNGVGIPAGRAETETGIRDGLGIQLIRGFARQLGAQLEVHEGEGTCYTLTFPLHPQEEEEDSTGPEDARADVDEDEGASRDT